MPTDDEGLLTTECSRQRQLIETALRIGEAARHPNGPISYLRQALLHELVTCASWTFPDPHGTLAGIAGENPRVETERLKNSLAFFRALRVLNFAAERAGRADTATAESMRTPA
jgi:hypothetical protein